MNKELALKVAKVAGAGALGALIPMLPELVKGLPDGSASVLGAVVAAVLLYLKRP